MAKQKYYVVWKGRRPGVFDTWAACSAQVLNYPGAEYKSFDSLAAAQAAFRATYADFKGKPFSSQGWLFTAHPPLLPSLSVDAACDGSPGNVEWRGVDTESGQQVFHQGPFPEGTNNVGEFLAIVHALAWLKEKNRVLPVYSDSENALAWVKARKCRTKLVPTARNAPLFDLIARAEQALASLETGGILKWDTHAWGENPADFGRK
jgi:ribonuclease HI